MALTEHSETETTPELEQELADALVAVGVKNMSPPEDKTEDEKREWAMRNIAHPIAEAIRQGSSLDIKGTATVAEISALKDMKEGDIWAASDSGYIFNRDGSALSVTAGDLVRYDGENWTRFLHLDLSGYATTTELNAAVASLTAVITAHTANMDNPHKVTAEQVDTYDKATIDAKITEGNGKGLFVLNQQLRFG